jgi:hypothetical protein
MTGTQTLQVVHGLVSNLKLVIDGMQLSFPQILIAHGTVRIDGMAPMHDMRQALGMLGIPSMSMRLTADTSHDSRDNKPDKQDET